MAHPTQHVLRRRPWQRTVLWRSPALAAVCAITVSLALAACGGSGTTSAGSGGSPAALTKVSVASTSPAQLDVTPLYYANATDLWKSYGLDVSFTDLTPAAGVAALVSGSVDIFVDGTGSLQAAVDNGKVVVTATYSQPALDIVINPRVVKHFTPIKTVAELSELKGLTYGGTSQGSLVDEAFRGLLQQAHLTPGSSLKMVYLGAGALSALEQGEIGVTILAAAQIPPAEAAGMKIEGSINQLTGGRGILGLVGTNKAFLQSHPKAVMQFANAYRRAITLSSQHSSANMADAAKATQASISATTEAYKLQAPYIFLKPVPTAEVKLDLRNIAITDPAAKNASLSAVLDNGAMN